MIEVKLSQFNTWLIKHKLQNDYYAKIVKDPLKGKIIALYKIYNNDSKELVAQAINTEKLVTYVCIQENIEQD